MSIDGTILLRTVAALAPEIVIAFLATRKAADGASGAGARS